MKMSQKINEEFFTNVGSILSGNCGDHVKSNANNYGLYTQLEYNFDLINTVENLNSSELANIFCGVYADSIKRAYESMTEKYNPLYNSELIETETTSGTDKYNRSEEFEDKTTKEDIQSGSDKGHSTGTGKRNLIDSESENSETTYDNSVYVPVTRSSASSEQEATSNQDTEVTYGKTVNSNDNTEGTRSRNDSTEYGKTITRERRGNIGTVTNQDILEKEIKLRFNYNFYIFLMSCIVNAFSSGVFSNED